jgi:formiminotetrahydrofolate cyclodeaminase
VAALLLSAALEGALANVRINLGGIADATLRKGFEEDAADLAGKGAASLDACRTLARGRGLVA